MRLSHRRSIGTGLGFIAIIAVNLAAWRSLSEIAASFPFGFALGGPDPQVGLSCPVDGRNRVHGLWFGFVMAGLAAAPSHIRVFAPGSLGGAIQARCIIKRILPWQISASYRIAEYEGDPVYPVVIALIMGLPQWLIALAGGMLMRSTCAMSDPSYHDRQFFRARVVEGAEVDRRRAFGANPAWRCSRPVATARPSWPKGVVQ